MDFTKNEWTPEEEKKEQGTGNVEIEVPLKEVIDALLELDDKDKQEVYDALGKSLWEKKPEGEPKKEEAPKDEWMNPQDLAKAFM